MVKKFNNLFILFILVGLSFVVFGNGLNGAFVYDDQLVLAHSFFSEPVNFLKFFGQPYFETYPQAGLYRPMTMISYAFNFMIGGTPTGFHVVNIILHGLNSFLVYWLIFTFSRSGRIALLTALLFLVLPIHVEAITSIIGRAELLMFLFSILSLILWYKQKYLFSAVFFAAAMFSKETTLFLPILLAILAFFYGRDFKWLWHLGVSGAVYLIARYAVLKEYFLDPSVEFVFNPLISASFVTRVATTFKLIFLYIEKILVPTTLTADYSFDQIPLFSNLFSSPEAIVGLISTVGLLYLTYIGWKKKSYLVLGTLLFLLPYLIVSNLLIQTGTIFAERLMYLPSVGIVLLVAAVIDQVINKSYFRWVIYAIFSLLLFSYSFVTYLQNRVWASEFSLFENMFKKSPHSLVAKNNWAKIHFDGGRQDFAAQLSQEVYDSFHDFIPNLNLLARVKFKESKLSEAQALLERARELRPLHQETLVNLSRVYFARNNYEKAAETAQVLADTYDGRGNVLLLAVAKINTGKYQEAIDVIIKYIGTENTDEAAKVVLAYSYLKMGNIEMMNKYHQNQAQLLQQFNVLNDIFKTI